MATGQRATTRANGAYRGSRRGGAVVGEAARVGLIRAAGYAGSVTTLFLSTFDDVDTTTWG